MGSNTRRNGSASQYYGDNSIEPLRASCGMDARGSKAGKVTCLRCEKTFESEDRTRIRVCHRCKGSDAWKQAAAGDDRYPSARAVTEFKKRAGRRQPHCATENARKTRAEYLKTKRVLSESQKEFGKKPRARQRTRA